MITIAITGPESTGKSWLAEALSSHYNGVLIPEFARTYLETLNREYTPEDVVFIGKEQNRLLQKELDTQNVEAVISDTELLVISIWLEHKYGIVDPWVETHWVKQPFDFYLLCDIDMPWTWDPLREHPHDREVLMDKYVDKLDHANLPYFRVQGTGNQRLQNALEAIEHHGTQKC
jgi:nicotinamide riboside kinase